MAPPALVIFDCDGVLVDSEPLWRQAEREIFRIERRQIDHERHAERRDGDGGRGEQSELRGPELHADLASCHVDDGAPTKAVP